MKKEMKCVHCLKVTSDWNWDHIFPASWYPDTTPPNLEKWQVPSCQSCNSEYGLLENDLMVRIGLCIDPNDSKSSSIAQKALRAINPAYGKNDKDRRARLTKQKEILGDIFKGDHIPYQSIYPGFENKWNIPKEKLLAIKYPADSIRRLNEKIVKGIFLLEDRLYVETPFKISFWVADEAGAEPIKELIRHHGKEYAREPGIVVHRAVAPEDGFTSLYFTEIWGQFRMYGSIEREQLIE